MTMLARRLGTIFVLGIAGLLQPPLLDAATAEDSGDAAHRDAIGSWVAAHRGPILDDLKALLSLPNDATDHPAMRRNAEWIVAELEERGARAELLETAGSGPYLYAELAPGDGPPEGPPLTILFYCHYDGQPVDPSKWTRGAPYAPALEGNPSDPDARIYARSASDAKGPIIALLAAIDALRSAGIPRTVHLKLILDPEEEISSPHLRGLLAGYAELLRSDLMIFADGPVFPTGKPTLVFGVRGIVTVTLELYGPASALHSGHYGNWAPNPAEKLSRLIASMKDAEGRVLVAGFYDGVEPLGSEAQAALERIPAVEPALMDALLIARPDGGGRSLQDLINLPSLNLRGLRAGSVGDEARTIVPSSAIAEIDMRLVKGVTPDSQVARLREHIGKQGFFVVDREPTAEERRAHPLVLRLTRETGIPASRTSMETPLSLAVTAAVRRAVEGEVIMLPTLGGTGPLSLFEEALALPVYTVPIVNHDNNQHGPDENLRLGNLWRGIAIYASLLRLARPAP
jgi:acetylornithine deacetylase/succinyl-diaminopimelate desuccinylase-like protein